MPPAANYACWKTTPANEQKYLTASTSQCGWIGNAIPCIRHQITIKQKTSSRLRKINSFNFAKRVRRGYLRTFRSLPRPTFEAPYRQKFLNGAALNCV
jgi:hypothetical protein